jgi:thymidylate synthase
MSEVNYLNMLKHLVKDGYASYAHNDDYKAFAIEPTTLVFNLKNKEGINILPLMTTKKMSYRLPILELLWVMSGSTNNNDLLKDNVHIWDEWQDAGGELGPVYGFQWRRWIDYNGETYDQLANFERRVKSNPFTRSAYITASRPDMESLMSIKNCHVYYQIVTRQLPDGNIGVTGHLTQRSCDSFLGVPFNICQYAWFTHLVAYHFGFVPEKFCWTGVHVHLYENHFDVAKEQYSRKPFEFPTIKFTNQKSHLWEYTLDDFIVKDYVSHPALKADVSLQGHPGTGKKIS